VADPPSPFWLHRGILAPKAFEHCKNPQKGGRKEKNAKIQIKCLFIMAESTDGRGNQAKGYLSSGRSGESTPVRAPLIQHGSLGAPRVWENSMKTLEQEMLSSRSIKRIGNGGLKLLGRL